VIRALASSLHIAVFVLAIASIYSHASPAYAGRQIGIEGDVMPPSRRAHLVEAAARLFEQQGYHATGIDHILEVAGVAKMTLYNHFKSKEELIIATLEWQNTQFMARLKAHVDDGHTPQDRLLGIFSFLERWMGSTEFRGCPFVTATQEYADRHHPIHVSAATHKRNVFTLIQTLTRDVGHSDSRLLAQQLLLLYEGALSVGHALDAPIAARQARRAAETLISAS
jgi:AcrR family transcriptional regulator